jgi:5-methyltetrahydrofolate--homocysteine methyltransferase
VSAQPGFDIGIIGERIDPGFRSTRALFDSGDMAGIQALAVRQAEAGACYLNISVGARALIEPEFMAEIVRVVQAATTVPPCFDFPGFKAQEACMKAFDPARADGRKPLVNSITEHRWEVMDLHEHYDFKVIVMTSERADGGVAVGNRTAEEIHTTGRRCALRLMRDYGLAPDDIYLDMSVSAVIADKEGLNRNAIEAIRLIGADSALKGVHMVGGLSHIGQQLPPRAADGSDLRLALECAFLTLTVPYGFDHILGTPWRAYAPLPGDNYVLQAYRHFLEQTGSSAIRAVRRFYKA